MKNKTLIYCFGNEYVENDDVAKALAKKIREYKNFIFISAESPNEILKAEGDIWILDVAKGISEAKLISNPKKLELSKSLTCHDLDLGFYIKLLTETGKIKNVNIIALPYGEKNLEKLEKEIVEILEST